VLAVVLHFDGRAYELHQFLTATILYFVADLNSAHTYAHAKNIRERTPLLSLPSRQSQDDQEAQHVS
jgi:hypothetical protein